MQNTAQEIRSNFDDGIWTSTGGDLDALAMFVDDQGTNGHDSYEVAEELLDLLVEEGVLS